MITLNSIEDFNNNETLIIIISLPNCRPCIMVSELLEKKNIFFKKIFASDLDNDDQELIFSVPTILVINKDELTKLDKDQPILFAVLKQNIGKFYVNKLSQFILDYNLEDF